MYAKFLLSREQSNTFLYATIHRSNTGLHFHSQLEFCLIESGEMEIWINGHYKKMKSGDISLAFSFDAHAYRTTGNCMVHLVIIPTDLCPDILSELQHKRPRTPFINDPELYKLIQDCCKEIKKDPHSITSRGYLYVMLGTLLKKTELTEMTEPMETDRMTRLLFYINDHFCENLTLSDVARQFGYSASYLSRHFKATFQIGFSQYVTMLRLRAAVDKMREGGATIETILTESGFSSTRTFYRAFFAEFGCSPKKYLQGEN